LTFEAIAGDQYSAVYSISAGADFDPLDSDTPITGVHFTKNFSLLRSMISSTLNLQFVD
jgi:hypothetical protein